MKYGALDFLFNVFWYVESWTTAVHLSGGLQRIVLHSRKWKREVYLSFKKASKVCNLHFRNFRFDLLTKNVSTPTKMLINANPHFLLLQYCFPTVASLSQIKILQLAICFLQEFPLSAGEKLKVAIHTIRAVLFCQYEHFPAESE